MTSKRPIDNPGHSRQCPSGSTRIGQRSLVQRILTSPPTIPEAAVILSLFKVITVICTAGHESRSNWVSY